MGDTSKRRKGTRVGDTNERKKGEGEDGTIRKREKSTGEGVHVGGKVLRKDKHAWEGK